MKKRRLQVGRSNDLSMHRLLRHQLNSPGQSPRAFRQARVPFSPQFSQTARLSAVYPSWTVEVAAVAPIRALLQKEYAHRTDYLEIVREWDRHRSGAVHAEDLAAIVTSHGLACSRSEAAAVIASVTTAGLLTASEVKALLTSKTPSRPARLFVMPQVTDRRRRKRQELKVLLSFMSLSKARMTELLLAQDVEDTGKVSYDQFLQVINRLNVPYKFVNGCNIKALYEELGGTSEGLEYDRLLDKKQLASLPPKAILSKTVSTRHTSMQPSAPRRQTKTPTLAGEIRILNRCHNPAVKFYLPRDEARFGQNMDYARLKQFLGEITDKILKGLGYDSFSLKTGGFISKQDIICLLRARKIEFDERELDSLLPEPKDKLFSMSDLNMRVTGKMYDLSEG